MGVWSSLAIGEYSFAWAGLLVLVAFVMRRRWMVLVAVVAGIALGNWYGGVALQQSSVSSRYIGQYVQLTGTVREDPTLVRESQLRLQLQDVVIDGAQVSGGVWVSSSRTIKVLRGDRVTVSGEFEGGFGSFVGMLSRAQLEEVRRPVPGDLGRVVRDWFADAVRRAIPEPQASLGIGFLTGQKSALPEDVMNSFQIAGLTHIVVASGYNLTILVRLARRLFAPISKYLSVLSASSMIIGFICVTGLSPSMTRAGLVSGLSLLAWSYGRCFHPMVLLPFVAAMTVAWQPSYVWGDLGWQLSFAAFFGVMVLAPLLQRYFFGDTPPGVLRQVLGETIAAHIVTVPIVLSAFGLLSNVAVIANLLIVPLVPLAMLLTFVSGIVALTVPSIAGLVGIPITWLLGYMLQVSETLSELPWAQAELQPEGWFFIVYVAGLLLVWGYLQRATKYQLARENVVA